MNVRRGTFRLWVFLSVLFAVGVAIYSYSDIRMEFRDADTDWNAEFAKYGGVSLVPVDCGQVRGMLGADYTREADGLCWYDFRKFRALYPEYKDVNDELLSEKLYAKVGKPLVGFHPWAKLAKTAGVAIGVPMVVLIVGVMLFWALAGFKPSPSRDPH